MRVRGRWFLAVMAAGVALVAGCGGPAGPADATTSDPAGGSIAPSPLVSDVAGSMVTLLRPDARVDCAPSVTELPGSAVAGIVCLVATEPVASVEVVAFDTVRDAARAYLRTLETAGVRPRSGTCESGKGGDGAWAPGDDPRDVSADDGVAFKGSYFIPQRYGCFVEDGVAHAIATCGKHLVEVVGTGRALEPLHTWVWTYADEIEREEPVPPGICTGS